MSIGRARGQSVGRVGPALLLVLALSLLGVAPATAGTLPPPTPVGPHTGNYGVHGLIDNTDFTGVVCVYPDGNHLTQLRVRPPIIYAFDRTAGTDSQTVGWFFRGQYADTGIPAETDWHDFFKSPTVKVTATDAYNAQWTNRSVTIPFPTETHIRYRASVKMLWYRTDGTAVDGSAIHLPRYYGYKVGDMAFIHQFSACGDTLG